MPTKETIDEIDLNAVRSKLREIVVSTDNKYLLMYSLVLLYELEIVLISADHKGDRALDKYGYDTYGSDWVVLLNVSNSFRHNTYSVKNMKKYLQRFIDAPVVYKVLTARGFTEKEVDRYIESLKVLYDNM